MYRSCLFIQRNSISSSSQHLGILGQQRCSLLGFALSSQISIIAGDYSGGAFLSMVFVLGTISLFFVHPAAAAECPVYTSVERDKIFVRWFRCTLQLWPLPPNPPRHMSFKAGDGCRGELWEPTDWVWCQWMVKGGLCCWRWLIWAVITLGVGIILVFNLLDP